MMESTNFMRDPSTSNCRIYIGHLPSNCRKEVEDHFSKFGPVLGVILNRGFGFVQFDNPDSAQDAIQSANGSIFMGQKISVCQAVSQGPPGQGGPNDGGLRGGRGGARGGGRGGGMNRGIGNFNNGGNQAPGILNNGNQMWNQDRERSPLDENRGGNMNFGGGGNRNPIGVPGGRQDNYDWSRDNFNDFGNTGNSMPFENFNNRPAVPTPAENMATGIHNDCEIIVVSRTLTEYAEMIENHLKRRGMTVDLLFPNDDVPIGKVLANISSRGTLYAILVTPQNEEHRSITVNILYGTPAEHRNMPVEDALNFIVGNFQQKLKCEQAGIAVPPAVPIKPLVDITPPLSERHPDAIQILFNLLANNRPLTVLQYDRIIHYLDERRESQKRVEFGDDDVRTNPIRVANARTGPDAEEELQKKIMSILNKPSITAAEIKPVIPKTVAPQPKQPQAPATSSSTSSSTLLHDPKVQRALDSLLSGLGGGKKF